MQYSARQRLVDLVKKTGLRYDHIIIPTYYLPYVFLDGLAAGAPVQCDFEVTYRCNMYCDMCPQVSHRKQHLGGGQIRYSIRDASQLELATDEIKRAITDLANAGTKIVQFTGGEAFLRRDLCDILTHAKHAGLHVALITNGSLITPDIAAHLVRIGVNAITFSLDGPKALHNEIRHLADGFDKLRNSIRLIQLEMDRQKVDRPRLSLSAVIMQQNQDCLADIVDAAQKMGVMNLSFNFPFYTTPELESETWKKLGSSFVKGAKPEEQSNLGGHHNLIPKGILSQLSEARKRAALNGITINTSPSLRDDEVSRYIEDPSYSIVRRCFYPWKTMRVNAWGYVYPCSIDIHLGNIRQQGIVDIWNGESYRAFRTALKGNSLFPQCAKCCVLTNRTWNRLPKLSVDTPEFGRRILQRIHKVI